MNSQQKKRCLDINKLQNYLKIDPIQRSNEQLNEIYNEIKEMEFINNLIEYNLVDFIINVCCKYMTIITSYKKNVVEQNRDNIQIILEGSVSAYIPQNNQDGSPQSQQQQQQNNEDTMNDEQNKKNSKKKYIHTINVGQCINLLSICFNKISSFYFDCHENITLLNIPCNINNTQLVVPQIYPFIKSQYDFIFESLISLDSFYTQQQVRDILFVSKKHHFKKGSIQLKQNGLIIFIQKGEFSTFKDFIKQDEKKKSCVNEDDFSSLGGQNKKQNQMILNQQDDHDYDDETNKITDSIELQNLKVQFKKRSSQLLKRIRLGIKKAGSLIVLSKMDESIDGIECVDIEGIAYICTEEQYEQITKEQDRRSNNIKSNIVSNQINNNIPQINNNNNNVNYSNQQQNIPSSNNEGSQIYKKSNQNILKKQQTEIIPFKSNLKENHHQQNHRYFKEQGQQEILLNTQLKEQQQQQQQQQSQEQSEENHKLLSQNGQKLIYNSKGNKLRSKNELDYRKSLINNIGQSINQFGNFFYTIRNNDNNKQDQKQQKQFLEQRRYNNQQQQKKCLTERSNHTQSPSQQQSQQQNLNQNTKQQLKTTENQQIKSKNQQTFTDKNNEIQQQNTNNSKQTVSRASKLKKSQTFISPFQQSVKNTVRGNSNNQQIQINQQIQMNQQITMNQQIQINQQQIDQSTYFSHGSHIHSNSPSMQNILGNESQLSHQNKNKINFVRSKSAFQLLSAKTPKSDSICFTPSSKLIDSIDHTPIHNKLSTQDNNNNNLIQSDKKQSLIGNQSQFVPKIDIKDTPTNKNENNNNNVIKVGQQQQYSCGYNFVTTCESTPNIVQYSNSTPSQTDSPAIIINSNEQISKNNNYNGTFSESIANNNSKSKITKKSSHFEAFKQNVFRQSKQQLLFKQDDEITNNKTSREPSIENKITQQQLQQQSKQVQTSDNNQFNLHYDINKYQINPQIAQSSPNIIDEQNSTLNYIQFTSPSLIKDSNNNYNYGSSNNKITSLNNLQTHNYISTNNLNTQQSSYHNFNSFNKTSLSSFKQNRIQSAQYQSDKKLRLSSESNIFKQTESSNRRNGAQTGRSINNNNNNQGKNIMEILYPSKMKKLNHQMLNKQQQQQLQSQQKVLSNKEINDNIQMKSNNNFNKNQNELSVQQDFQIFLQKKLRPQSGINHIDGKQQIDILNKKVFNLYVKSLNNTPSSKISQQQKLPIEQQQQ